MKIIRHGVFETNSSSSHSISISGKDRMNFNDGSSTLTVYTDEYGWGYDKLNTVGERLSYVVTSLRYYDDIFTDWLKEMIEESTGKSLIIQGDDGYVDHQSTDTLDEYFVYDEFEFKEKIKDLIFNDKYTIIIDNDNH